MWCASVRASFPAQAAPFLEQDAQAEEPRLGLLLSGVLLQDEPDAEQHGAASGLTAI